MVKFKVSRILRDYEGLCVNVLLYQDGRNWLEEFRRLVLRFLVVNCSILIQIEGRSESDQPGYQTNSVDEMINDKKIQKRQKSLIFSQEIRIWLLTVLFPLLYSPLDDR